MKTRAQGMSVASSMMDALELTVTNEFEELAANGIHRGFSEKHGPGGGGPQERISSIGRSRAECASVRFLTGSTRRHADRPADEEMNIDIIGGLERA